MSVMSTITIIVTGASVLIACLLTWQITTSSKKENKNMALSARTVMVTGASRGLGLEYIKQLTKLPTPPEVVIAACRSPASATDLQAVAKENPTVKVVKLDVAKDEDIDAAVKEVTALVGEQGLNLLINNAGIYDQADKGTLETQTREKMQRHFDTNVSGPVIMSQKFLPLIKKAAAQNESLGLSCSRAGIIMMTSFMGSQTVTFSDGAGLSMHYKCSKSALNMAAIMMHRELKDSGIFVAALHPGWVRTDMGSSYAPTLPEESIRGCLKVIGGAGEEKAGKLLTFQDEVLPY